MAASNRDYHVFIAYHFPDETEVTAIIEWLKKNGVEPWISKNLKPGIQWTNAALKVISSVPCAALFVGKSQGKWQGRELSMLTETADQHGRPSSIIPVLLPGVEELPDVFKMYLPDVVPVQLSKDLQDEAPLRSLLDAIKDAVCQTRSSSAFEIEIEIPDVARSCFIASPTPSGLDLSQTTSEAINVIRTEDKAAKSRCASLPERIVTRGQTRDGEKSASDIVRNIRASELVVADCTRDDAGHISAEVAYQLGMAHALGKPSIIITDGDISWLARIPESSPELLPIIQTVNVPRGAVRREEFSRSFVGAIRNTCDRIEAPFLIDREVDGIQVLSSDLKYLRSKLWPKFHHIISFGIKTQGDCRPVMQESHTLLRFTDEIVDWVSLRRGMQKNEQAVKARSNALLARFTAFLKHHSQWENEYLAYLKQQTSSLRETFAHLRIDMRDELCERLSGSQTCFDNVMEDIEIYRQRYSAVRQLADEEFVCLTAYASTQNLRHETTQMHSAIGLVYADTQNMVTKLLELVLGEERENVYDTRNGCATGAGA